MILTGNVLSIPLQDESVDCVVTSPPYWGLRDYGEAGQLGLEETPEEYVANMVSAFREVWRVLKPEGTLWLNLGDSYAGSRAGPQGETGEMNDRSVAAQRCRTRNGAIPGSGGQQEGQRNRDRCPLPPGLKPKDLVGIPWRVAFALQADGWWLRSDIIWCLSGGVRLYARTQKGDGPHTLKDLVRLDPSTVQLWNGERWTHVLGWSESPKSDNPLEIELRSGERIGCTPAHVWPTQRGDVRADELHCGDVIQTTTLPDPLVYQPKNISTDVAWMFGLWLAEGSFDGKDRLQFSGHADQTELRLARLGPVAHDFGGTARGYTNGNSGSVVVDCPPLAAIVRQYIHGRSSHAKGLRSRCWKHDSSWLAALLRGYLDGDGHHDKINDRWRLGFTRNDRLAADLRTIFARVGGVITLKAKHGTGFGKLWPIYRGEFRWKQSNHRNAKDRGEVVRIGRSRARKFWDVGVADDPHLFALASGVLTHNSKPNPMPESVRDRPTKSHEYLFLLTRSPVYYFDQDAVREIATGRAPGNKVDHKHTAAYVNGDEHSRTKGGLNRVGATDRRNIRDVWTISTQGFPGEHFAVMPPKLVEPCIKAGCPEGGTVLDPFCGAGTVGLVADRLRRNFVGVELNPDFARVAQTRIVDDCPLFHQEGCQ